LFTPRSRKILVAAWVRIRNRAIPRETLFHEAPIAVFTIDSKIFGALVFDLSKILFGRLEVVSGKATTGVYSWQFKGASSPQ